MALVTVQDLGFCTPHITIHTMGRFHYHSHSLWLRTALEGIDNLSRQAFLYL